jgi:hypothetical protein
VQKGARDIFLFRHDYEFLSLLLKFILPLQNPTSGNPHHRRGTMSVDGRQATVDPRHGVGQRVNGCMALQWWRQCYGWSPWGTRQYPLVFMPCTPHGRYWWWLLFPHYMRMHMEISNKHKPLQVQQLCFMEEPVQHCSARGQQSWWTTPSGWYPGPIRAHTKRERERREREPQKVQTCWTWGTYVGNP